jgi:PII-like signaling protein
MQTPLEGSLLRIFIGETDHYEGKPLYKWIVLKAREEGLAGATVLRGIMGFGGSSHHLQTFRFETVFENLPVVVEIVDTQPRLEAFLELVEPHIKAGLVTIEKAQIKIYRFQQEKDK